MNQLLIQILKNPQRMESLSPIEWEHVTSLARITGTLQQLASRWIAQRNGISVNDPKVCELLHAEAFVAEQHAHRYKWEVDRIRVALQDTSTPLILLKGAAFLYGEFDWCCGRTFEDVDTLVPRDKLDEVVQALKEHDWEDSCPSPLDADYFRVWLHELAPLWHADRKIRIDIHHTIIPPRDRLKFDPQPLFEEIVELKNGVYTLAPIDMFLHASTNLFYTGEFHRLLRDLYDMHAMLNQFTLAADFWPQLMDRAVRLNLTRPLYFALRYLQQYFDSEIPDDVKSQMKRYRPPIVILKYVDWLVDRCILPRELDEIDNTRQLAMTLRDYWAIPRMSVLFSREFWLKRLPKWFDPQLRAATTLDPQ